MKQPSQGSWQTRKPKNETNRSDEAKPKRSVSLASQPKKLSSFVSVVVFVSVDIHLSVSVSLSIGISLAVPVAVSASLTAPAAVSSAVAVSLAVQIISVSVSVKVFQQLQDASPPSPSRSTEGCRAAFARIRIGNVIAASVNVQQDVANLHAKADGDNARNGKNQNTPSQKQLKCYCYCCCYWG